MCLAKLLKKVPKTFLFGSPDTWMSRNMNKLCLYILDPFFLIENVCWNCLKIVRIEEEEEKEKIIFFLFFYDRKVHEQVGMIRRRLFLQLSEAHSTGLRRQRPPAETAARWRCGLLIKNVTAPYNCQFCDGFHFCIDREPPWRL